MNRSFYVTTPIYYANADPHIGHTYTTIVADTLVRWHRLCGEDAFSVSGTDEHGEYMVEAATKRGLEPAAFTAAISARFQQVWAELKIAPSRFVRTTDPVHQRNVQTILQRVYDAGWIELREYQGLYCVGCERFLTERDLVNGLCKDHERAPEPRREVNYFFLMSREFDWLRRTLEERADLIRPERYRNEALAMLRDESGLGDLSISRPKTRLDWGIELPFDRDHVCYVWFDALISYLTGAGYPDDPKFSARWSAAEHLIGKDILKPHAIFWPIMLKAIGLEPPRHIRVHGFWNVDDRKVSKSLGNMISPLAMEAKYGFESFRHYLLREMSFGLDAAFSEAALIERVNADLANNLGNLVSRTLNLVDRFCGGTIPAAQPLVPEALAAAGRELRAAAGRAADAVDTHLRAVEPHRALEVIFGLVSMVNRFVDLSQPWKVAKDPAHPNSVGPLLAVPCEALRVIALLLAPFLPAAAQEIVERLGVPEAIRAAQLPRDAGRWGQLPVGAAVHKGDALFPRLEPLAAEGDEPSA
jgi:methionyl-tRNA synthetase